VRRHPPLAVRAFFPSSWCFWLDDSLGWPFTNGPFCYSHSLFLLSILSHSCAFSSAEGVRLWRFWFLGDFYPPCSWPSSLTQHPTQVPLPLLVTVFFSLCPAVPVTPPRVRQVLGFWGPPAYDPAAGIFVFQHTLWCLPMYVRCELSVICRSPFQIAFLFIWLLVLYGIDLSTSYHSRSFAFLPECRVLRTSHFCLCERINSGPLPFVHSYLSSVV